jgi:hypothetical protein
MSNDYLPGGFHHDFRRSDEPFMSPSNGGRGLRFFQLLEDMPAGHGIKVWAQFLDWDDNPTGEDYLYNWGRLTSGIIDNVPAGFKGTCAFISGRWAFNQAECNQRCETTASIPIQTPPPALIGQDDYSYSVVTSGTVDTGTYLATGLPSGWNIDADTGVITGPAESPGIEGPARDVPVIVTAWAPSGASGGCMLTRRLIITIEEDA